MLKDAQKNLKEQLQQMIEQMKNGESGRMSEQIGKTLAQQEMMQQMVRELMMNSGVGSSAKEQLKQINQLLEQNNVDLANKEITSAMISRHNLILNKNSWMLLKEIITNLEFFTIGSIAIISII